MSEEEKNVNSAAAGNRIQSQRVDIDFVYNAIQGPVTLIDLRGILEYNACHIYTAIQVSLDMDKQQHITNIMHLESSHPQRIKHVSGKVVILYGSKGTEQQKYDFILKLLHKHIASLNLKYFVMDASFNEFKSKNPFLCEWDKDIVASAHAEEPLFDQKSDEESNIATYKRYEDVWRRCSHPSVIISDKLFLGDARQAINSSVIYDLGITHIVNVTKAAPNQFENVENMQSIKDNMLPSIYSHFDSNPVKYLKLDLLDEANVSIQKHFDEAISFLDNAMSGDSNNRILIHCQMGISRSSTILIAFLMQYKQWTLVTAYEHVKNCRSKICPNDGFLEQLERYEKTLFDGNTTVEALGERGLRDLSYFYAHKAQRKSCTCVLL